VVDNVKSPPKPAKSLVTEYLADTTTEVQKMRQKQNLYDIGQFTNNPADNIVRMNQVHQILLKNTPRVLKYTPEDVKPIRNYSYEDPFAAQRNS